MEREVKIKVTKDDRGVVDLKAQLKELTQHIKAVELGFKSGNLTQQQAQERFKQLADQIKATGASETQLVDISQRLWHANNRVEIGFKSAASTWMQANKELRALNQEQKVGNVLLNNIGGILGGKASGVIGQYQQFEGVLQTVGIAMPKVGSALNGLIGPLAATGAGILLIADNARSMEDRMKAADDAIIKLRLDLGLLSKEDYLGTLRTQINELDGEADRIKAKADLWASLGFKLIPSLFGISEVDAKEATQRLLELQKKVREAEGTNLTPEQQAKENIALAEKQFKLGLTTKENLLIVLNSERLKFKLLSDQYDVMLKIQELNKTEKGKAGDPFFYLSLREGSAALEAKQAAEERAAAAGMRKRLGGRGMGGYDTGTGLGGDNFQSSVKKGTDKAKQEVNEFEQMAIGSFNRMGNTIGSTLGQGFVDAFGIGHTLIGQFFADLTSQALSFIASGILQSIFNIGSGGIFGAIGGLFSGGGSAAPVGGGLGMFASGAVGSGTISPIGRTPSAPIIVNVNGDFGYDRLSFAVAKGDRMRATRTF